MDGVRRVGHQDGVAGAGDGAGEIGKALLGPKRGDNLGLRVQLHIEAAGVITGKRAAQGPVMPRLGGIAVGARVRHRFNEFGNDVRRGGAVRVAHAEIDDVLAGGAGARLGGVDLSEDVGREAADAVEFFGHLTAPREGRPSFLKKRSKKLLSLGRASPQQSRWMDKSFLVLFLEKEHLASLHQPHNHPPPKRPRRQMHLIRRNTHGPKRRGDGLRAAQGQGWMRRWGGGRRLSGICRIWGTRGRFFKEALRMYPPAYVFGRRAAEDVEVCGYRIPKGTVLLMSPYMIQHRAEFFPDPYRFDPDRFAPEAEKRFAALCVYAVRGRASGLHRESFRFDGGADSYCVGGAEGEV